MDECAIDFKATPISLKNIKYYSPNILLTRNFRKIYSQFEKIFYYFFSCSLLISWQIIFLKTLFQMIYNLIIENLSIYFTRDRLLWKLYNLHAVQTISKNNIKMQRRYNLEGMLHSRIKSLTCVSYLGKKILFKIRLRKTSETSIKLEIWILN